MRHVLTLAAGALLLAAGCNPYDPLPSRPARQDRSAELPAGSDVHAWSAETGELSTFWGAQRLKLRCRGCFPAPWRAPGDEAWSVEAVNAEGTRVPFLGVVRRYRDDQGKERAEILPPFDSRKLPDGLYIFIESAVRLAPGLGPAEIRPVAHLAEIRRGWYMPYRIRIPLVPEAESALTPRPQPGAPPRAALDGSSSSPRGTPAPF